MLRTPSPELLTADERRSLVQRVFWCGTSRELRQVEREIAARFAATPAQRAQNASELEWLRNVVIARRQSVSRG